MGILGFMLSPLSWWNDLLVNVPLAVAFGWLVALLHRAWFEPAVILGYWLTNVLGLILMQKGAQTALGGAAPRRYTRRDFARDLLISLLYTGVIVLLVKLKVLQPVGDYLTSQPAHPWQYFAGQEPLQPTVAPGVSAAPCAFWPSFR